MKLFKKIRKGFTLIELVVVIAVIAILAAVSVVSYVSITNRAKQSNDQQLIDQVNLSLDSHGISKKPSTMHEALQGVEEDGFIPANMKISPEFKGYTFAYNLTDNQFVILNEKKDVVYPKDARKDAAHYELWLFADGEADVEGEFKDYSHYVRAFEWTSTTDNVLTAEAGLDLGSIKNIGKVKYATNEAQDVVIRTVGDQTELEVNAPNANADFYGFTKKLDVTAIKKSSLHIYGTVYRMELESGHVAVENTGIVFDVASVASSGASVSNAGYIAQNSSSATIPSVGGDYEINSLERLEGFRDAVNAGNSFVGLTIKLTRDIALNDGWTPIGEGSRSVSASNTEAWGLTKFFAGTFDGQNHTISNLNNKGYVPTKERLVKDTVLEYAYPKDSTEYDTYSYGLFGLVEGSTAKFKNLKLTKVDIDGSRYSAAYMDSVGGLIGFAINGVQIDGVSVSGTIKGTDAVCGIAGRVAIKAGTASIINCTNNANVTSTVVCAGIARLYKASAGHTLLLQNNANNGDVVTEHPNRGYGNSVFIVTYSTANSGTVSPNTNKGVDASLGHVTGDTSEGIIG